MNFGKAIRLSRSTRGLSQKELAGRLGVDPSFVSLLESNRRKPSTETLESLSEALDIPLYLLILFASEKSDLRGVDPNEAKLVARSLLNLVLEANES